jgi:2-dehydro-3-deoxygluconokinase
LLADADAYNVHVAGSEANVAYAAARVGLNAAWVSALPDNPLGHRIATMLTAGGVDTSLVRWVAHGRLGLYFVELGTPPRPTNVIYDRSASAMAMAAPEIFDWTIAADTDFLHVSGITLGLSESCRVIVRQAMEVARSRGAVVTFDVNYRQRLWGQDAAARAARDIAPLVDVLICTAEDARDLFAMAGEPERMLAQLQTQLGVDTVVLTLGQEGAIATRAGATIRRSGHTVQTVDRVGAGDAFAAGLIWGLHEGSLELGLERGLAMSALKMTLHGDLFRLAASDVTAFLARDGREVGR